MRRTWLAPVLGGLGGLVALGGLACGDDGGGQDGGTESDSDTQPDGSTSAGSCNGPFELECPADTSVECEGPLTTVALDDPVAACDAWSVEGDGPASFPVGSTLVTYTLTGDGMETTCATEVTLTDTVAPEITCPPGQTLIRASENDALAPPPAAATDLCDENVTVVASTDDLPPGATEVVYTATDASGNESSCMTEFDVQQVLAAPGYRILTASLTNAGATEVTFGWELSGSPLVEAYRIETADEPDAAQWTEVASVDANTQLFTHELVDDAAEFRVVAVTEFGDGGATLPRRAYQIADGLYDIRDQTVPGIPFLTTLYGVTRYPTALAEGPRPLVLMLHGNHGICRSTPDGDDDYCVESNNHDCPTGDFTVPNAEGLGYLAETLAAQGFISVSVSGNAVNCRFEFIIERAQLLVEHIRRWADWNVDSNGPFGNTFVGGVDLSRVGVLGHSRGGDGVSHVPEVLQASPVTGATLESVFSLAPTDFQQAEVPGVDLMVLLPGCDGDVFTLEGMNHYDRSIGFDDGARRAQVVFIGANHNFFNTEWKTSEWDFFGGDPFCSVPVRPQKQEQQAMLDATAGSWFMHSLAANDPLEGFMRADEPSPSSMDLLAGEAMDMRWSYSASARTFIDRFEGANSPALNELGGSNAFVDYVSSNQCNQGGCSGGFVHLTGALRLQWAQGATPVASFGLDGFDASDGDALSFRVASIGNAANNGLTQQDFVLRVWDGDGDSGEFLVSDLKTLNHLYSHSNPRDLLETVRIPIADLADDAPDVDLDALTRFEFEMTALDNAGAVVVTDIELADSD